MLQEPSITGLRERPGIVVGGTATGLELPKPGALILPSCATDGRHGATVCLPCWVSFSLSLVRSSHFFPVWTRIAHSMPLYIRNKYLSWFVFCF